MMAHSRIAFMLSIEYTMLLVTILIVSCRFYSRTRIAFGLGAEDWTIFFALLGLIAIVITHTFMTTLGFGLPSIPRSQISRLWPLGVGVCLIYPPAAALIRISVLQFMRRLSPHQFVFYTTYFLIALNIVGVIVSECTILFRCSPISAFWVVPYARLPGTKCWSRDMTPFLIVPMINMVLDVMVWLVPVVMVARMRCLDLKQKVQLSGLLGIGLIELAVGIVASSIPSLNPIRKAWGARSSRQRRSATPSNLHLVTVLGVHSAETMQTRGTTGTSEADVAGRV
ncbi:Similar to hypothetical protein AOL_s00173g37 [Arthrobotrys oligospora ATCC 24927]; acc. no. EGX44936 [Pyronema omphalodes CBS 100304]|uniref:Rhodopsin domain-containing protein n=1 Tax=Pyronema omphalodes (strain CBS 100304) TaxID=1076935 RepID=U4LIF1_PYROM|nr:Similar to hypothetical protein AOL_s00173g37 [Arthrobotrys oligospora ATCC 24927]; acc. no. EGX44936 [Pyronema omphalodes CBS 100304]